MAITPTRQWKTITFEDPTTADEIEFFFTPEKVEFVYCWTVVEGTTPSVTWSLISGSAKGTGETTHIDGHVANTTGAGEEATIGTAASGEAARHVWVDVTAVTGTVDSFSVTVVYNITGP